MPTKSSRHLPAEVEGNGEKKDKKIKSKAKPAVKQADFSIEEKLKASEEKYKILYESSADAIMTLEPPTWNFTSGNPATIKLFACKNEKDFTSRGPEVLSPEKQPDGTLSAKKAKAMIMKAMKEGSALFDWTHKKVTGEDFPAIVLLTRVGLEKGEPFLQATVRDNTEQKKIENQLKEKLEEQEQMNKLMIGRELKMVELKERIKQLEQLLNKK